MRAFLLSLLIISLCGCATLPRVSEMEEASLAEGPPKIASAEGLLSPAESTALIEQLNKQGKSTDILQRHIAVLESVSGSLLTKGNRVTLLTNGSATYAAMFRAIRQATDHINIETFTLTDDEAGRALADLLLEKRAEGVAINLIYDSAGSFDTHRDYFERLRKGGIQVLEFNPLNPLKARGKWLPDYRDHRKILVVDGKLVITGGINITGIYLREHVPEEETSRRRILRGFWRDTDVQIEGPAVEEFQKLFLETWQKQGGTELPGRNYFPQLSEQGNDLVQVVGSTRGKTKRITFVMYVSAINFADHSVHITNAYFVPDRQLMNAFKDAVKRGVDVKLILPRFSKHSLVLYAGQYYYSELLRSGIKLYELHNSMLHAKTAVIDGAWSTVGSTNMDFLSLSKNDEVNTIVLSRDFAAEMENMFEVDLADSDRITLDEWQNRPLLPRVVEWFAHLFSQWL